MNGEIIQGIPDIIKSLKKNGHDVAIATGRNPILVGDLHQKLGVDHLVLANGGYVKSNEMVIREKYIPFKTVKKMMDQSDKLDFDLTIEYIDEYVSYRQNTTASKDFSTHFGLPIPNYDDHVYPDRHVFAFVIFDGDVVNQIKDDFPELQFNLSGDMAYDVNFKGDLKAEGVRHMTTYLGYELKDVYAFGDNHNDIHMIEEVGFGIAMGNAVKALKDVADYVTDDYDNQGVEKALRKFKLI